MKISVGKKKYEVKVAKTEEEKLQGLLNVDNLPENKGMLFIYDEPLHLAFWMKNTKIYLDIVFINEDLEVISIQQGTPMSEDLMEEDNAMYVLEVNAESGIKPGDYVDFEEDKAPVMKILAPDGSTLMELQGGERIVSRKESVILIKKAKKAYASQQDSDYKSLGKYIFKVFKGLDERDPEYVKLPD